MRSSPRTPEHRIFDAARTVLMEHGRLTTGQVAERAGISEALLYKRYGTKGGLIKAVLEDALGQMLAVIEDAALVPLDEERLRALASDVLVHLRIFIPMALTEMSERLDALLEDDEPPPMRALAAMIATIGRQVDGGAIRRTDAGIVARAFIGTIWQYAFEEALMRARGRQSPLSPDELTRNLAHFLWSSLSPPPPPPTEKA